MTTKFEAPCLSMLAVARLASGQRGPNADESQHLANCPMCRAQLADETQLAHAAAQEAVPAAIASLGRKPNAAHRPTATSRQSHWQHGMMAIVAIVAVAMMAQRMVTLPAALDAPREHAKGGIQVLGAVKDTRDIIHPLETLENLHRLQVGETLQLRVESFEPADVTLTDADDHTVYYQGEIPVGGWLPVGVEVTATGPLHLSLQICPRGGLAFCKTMELR